MTLLNRPTAGLHNVLTALYRCVMAHSPLSQAKLLALCGPTAATATNARMPGKTLNTWKKLGLFEVRDDIVRLAPGLPPEARDQARLTATLRGLALAPANNQNFWAQDDADDEEEVEEGESAETAGVRSADFTRALCWGLALPPLRLAGANWKAVDELQQTMLQPGCLALQNDTRWAGFRVWAPFLGFGWITLNNALVLDPTAAVRDALPAVLAGGRMTQRDFFDRLAEILPVLDGGAYRRQVEERFRAGHWEAPAPGRLSPTLSLALERLKAARLLEWEDRDDADRATLTDAVGRPTHTFSYVSLPGAAA
jgi:hypothetical protein